MSRVHSTQLTNVDIDVEIDVAHACLRRAVRAAFKPAAAAHAGLVHIRQPQAAPLRQRPAAFTSELPGQHRFLAALIGADDVRAKLAIAALVDTGHLLLSKDGVAEERVGPAGHRKHQMEQPGTEQASS